MKGAITVSDLMTQNGLEPIALEEQKRLTGGLFNSTAKVDNSTSFSTVSEQHIGGDVNGIAISAGGDFNFPPELLAALAPAQ